MRKNDNEMFCPFTRKLSVKKFTLKSSHQLVHKTDKYITILSTNTKAQYIHKFK